MRRKDKQIINNDCCNHFKSDLYYLAFEKKSHAPFAYCDNCEDFQFIGNMLQWMWFRLLTCFDDEYAMIVTKTKIIREKQKNDKV